jgi:asparagine synthase (glutamine-hydrolysing)
MCGISTALTLESQTFPATKASEQSSSSTSGTACSSIKNGTHVILNAYEATLEKEIDASLDRIAHRGPDARGIWLGKQGKVGKQCFIYH